MARLTADPELKTTKNGNALVSIRLAINDSKKNTAGQWEDSPLFIDATAFDSATRKSATMLSEGFKKGSRIFVEGRLVLDQWDDKTSGEKRQKIKMVIDSWQFVDKKDESAAPAAGSNRFAGKTAPAAVEEDSEIPF